MHLADCAPHIYMYEGEKEEELGGTRSGTKRPLTHRHGSCICNGDNSVTVYQNKLMIHNVGTYKQD